MKIASNDNRKFMIFIHFLFWKRFSITPWILILSAYFFLADKSTDFNYSGLI